MDGQHSSPFKRAVSLEIKFRDGPRLPPANLLRRLQRATSEPCPRAETLDEKLQRAEQNRQELRAQFLTKQRDRDARHAAYVKAMEERRKKHLALLQGRLDVASALRASQLEQRRSHARKLVGLQAVATRQEQRRQERRARLQDRLELATLHHSAEIGQRRNKAARLLARRDVALSRLMLRQEQQVYNRAKRLHEQQEDAEFRRRICLVHEQERLRQEHQMKLAKALETQLKMDELRELQRCMLNERMAQAEQARSMCLDFRAARAGARVTLARCRGYQAHTLREQEAKALRCKLEGQMRSAEERRQAALLSKVAKSRRTI